PMWARRFFFQAEDGIRDFHVTGVQTCALPILTPSLMIPLTGAGNVSITGGGGLATWDTLLDKPFSTIGSGLTVSSGALGFDQSRSEERRVGNECRGRGWS